VLVLAVSAVVISATAFASSLAGAHVLLARAATAADLAALAAADTVSGRLPGDACARAARAAELQGSRTTRCHVGGATAEVSVELDARAIAGVPVVASARAGPPGSASTPGSAPSRQPGVPAGTTRAQPRSDGPTPSGTAGAP